MSPIMQYCIFLARLFSEPIQMKIDFIYRYNYHMIIHIQNQCNGNLFKHFEID